MITFTVGQLTEAAPFLQKILQAKIPSDEASRVGLLLYRLDSHIVAAHNAKMPFFRKYGVEHGGIITIPDDRLPLLQTEIQPLLDTKVTVAEAEPLPLSLVDSIKAEIPKTTGSEWRALYAFLDLEEKKTEGVAA